MGGQTASGCQSFPICSDRLQGADVALTSGSCSPHALPLGHDLGNMAGECSDCKPLLMVEARLCYMWH